jgi:hypothetical protein
MAVDISTKLIRIAPFLFCNIPPQRKVGWDGAGMIRSNEKWPLDNDAFTAVQG